MCERTVELLTPTEAPGVPREQGLGLPVPRSDSRGRGLWEASTPYGHSGITSSIGLGILEGILQRVPQEWKGCQLIRPTTC